VYKGQVEVNNDGQWEVMPSPSRLV